MTNFEQLTPAEARKLFDEWVDTEAKNYTGKHNARYQINIEELVGGRKILRALIL